MPRSRLAAKALSAAKQWLLAERVHTTVFGVRSYVHVPLAAAGRASTSQLPPGLLRALKLLGTGVVVTGVSLAALPPLLSTQLGLQAVVSLVNSLQPGKVAIADVKLALSGPFHGSITLKGVTVHEPPEWGGQQLLAVQDVECTGSLWQLYRGAPNHVIMHNPVINGGYSAVARDFRIIRYLEVAGALEAPEEALQQAEKLEEAHGISSSSPPRPQHTPSDTSRPATDSVNAGNAFGGTNTASANGGASAASSESATDEGDAASAGLSGAVDKAKERAAGLATEAAEAAHTARSLAESGVRHVSSLVLDGEDAVARRAAAIAAQKLHRRQEEEAKAIEGEGAFMRTLTQADDEMKLNAELRSPDLRLEVREGRLQVNTEIRDILGGELEVVGAFSDTHLLWLQTLDAAAAAAQADGPSSSSSSSSGVLNGGDSSRGAGSSSSGGWQAGGPRWWHDQPQHPVSAHRLQRVKETEGGKARCTPGEWRLTAPNLDMRMRVWEVEVAAKSALQPAPPSFTLLHQPATMSLRFTPALSRFGLASINPLLGRVSSLSEGAAGRLHATFLPDGMSLPYTDASVVVDPMKLRLAAAPLVTQLVAGLHLPGSQLALGTAADKHQRHHHQRSHHKQHPQHKTQRQEEQEREEKEQQQQQQQQQQEEAGSDSPGPEPLLEAWASGQHVRIARSGVIEQRRVDMLIGTALEADPSSGVHLVLWGSMDPDSDQVRMTVGVPARTLAKLGLRDLPPDYALPLQLTGSLDAPQLQMTGVSTRVGQLLLRQAVLAHKHRAGQRGQQQGGAGSQQQQQQQKEAGGVGANAGQQPTPHPLPGSMRGEEAHWERREGHDKGSAGAASPRLDHNLGDGGEAGGGSQGHGWGPLARLRALGSWLLDVAMHVAPPSRHSLQHIEEQLAHDAANVPPLEFTLPWEEAEQHRT